MTTENVNKHLYGFSIFIDCLKSYIFCHHFSPYPISSPIGSYGDLCVIIEYCPYGNLLQFLRNRRELYQSKWQVPTTDPDKQFTLTDLVSAAFQVTRAMEFLASRKVRWLRICMPSFLRAQLMVFSSKSTFEENVKYSLLLISGKWLVSEKQRCEGEIH